MNVLGSLGSAIAQNPAIAVGIAELGGNVIGGAMDLFGSRQDRQERQERFQEEAKKTSEFLEKEAKLASEERKEVFGLEKERSKEMLDKELDYLSKLADKNIDLFNQYYGNLAKRRQELLAQGLTREEIPEFFNQVLASRQSIMAGASRVPDTYGGASLGSDLGALRMARMQQYQQAFTPLQQPQQLRMRETVTPAIRNLGNLYMSYQSQRLGQRGERPSVVQSRLGDTETKVERQKRRRVFADPTQSKEYADLLSQQVKEREAVEKIKKAYKRYKVKKGRKEKGMKLYGIPELGEKYGFKGFTEIPEEKYAQIQLTKHRYAMKEKEFLKKPITKEDLAYEQKLMERVAKKRVGKEGMEALIAQLSSARIPEGKKEVSVPEGREGLYQSIPDSPPPLRKRGTKKNK